MILKTLSDNDTRHVNSCKHEFKRMHLPIRDWEERKVEKLSVFLVPKVETQIKKTDIGNDE